MSGLAGHLKANRLVAFVLLVSVAIFQSSATTSARPLSRVVLEGDTLPDGTTVGKIENQQPVAISPKGEVPFWGLIQATTTQAVFTQAGVVVAVGDTLPDGTIVGSIAGPPTIVPSGLVAFRCRIGTASGPLAVCTQEGVAVAEGQTLPDGTVVGAIHSSTPAINAKGNIAFWGRIQGSIANAIVVTEAGVLVTEGDVLQDGTSLGPILGSPSMNSRGDVAFLGQVQGTTTDAIFTKSGVLVAEGDTLPDGTTIAQINLGLLPPPINQRGGVTFLARIDGTSIDAVFTQQGMILAEGDSLEDGTVAGAIAPEIAVNAGGEVVMRGRIDRALGPVALFSLSRVLLVEGHTLPDGTTVGTLAGGAHAVNARGEVASFGLTGVGIGTAMIFVVH